MQPRILLVTVPVLAFGAALGIGLAGAAAEPSRAGASRPATYATDLTGRLDAGRLAILNERLAAFERETSTQVLVYVDRSLPSGRALEEFATRTFEEWGIGQKGKDNGALFLAFLDDRVMRIEVGYGLEAALPDARAHLILDEHVKPAFRAGDFTGGVEAAADQVMAAARREPYQGRGRTVAEGLGGLSLRSLLEGAAPPLWPFAVAAVVAVLVTILAGTRAGQAPGAQRWLLAAAVGLCVAAGSLVVTGSAVAHFRILLAAVAAFAAGMLALALRRGVSAWSAAAKAPVVARWALRFAVLAWAAVAVLAALAAWHQTRGRVWPLVIALELALAAAVVAAAAQKTGYARIKGMVGPLGFMVAGALAPRLYDLMTGNPTAAGSLLSSFIGAVAVGLLFSTERGFSGGGSGYRSWSSGGWRSSSSSSSSSRSSSSSSSFSGGGGRSGGGGASSSW